MSTIFLGLDHLHEIENQLVDADFNNKWLIGAVVENYALQLHFFDHRVDGGNLS